MATRTPPQVWRVATRRSALARAQAGHVARTLEAATGIAAELVPMATTGDEHPDRAIASFDAKGLFVDRTRRAVLDGDCHVVVHSYKDLPSEDADGLVIGAVPERVDPRDALVTRGGHGLATLPRTGAAGGPVTVGTSSARRAAQLQHARRDLLVQPLRGNLDTRLRRVADGDLDAVVVALAGILRLRPSGVDVRVVPLEPGECLSAPAQGALAVECRVGDAVTRKALRRLDHGPTRTAVTAERELLRHVGGGCTAPVGAHARLVPGVGDPHLELLGMLADPRGTHVFRASHRTVATEPAVLGRTLAATLLAAGEGTLRPRTGGGGAPPAVGT